MASSSASLEPLEVFTSFPSPYTQSLILQALTSTLPRLRISSEPPTTSPPALQWADYDLLHLDDVLSHATTHLISSYVYRKTLIRKQNLQRAVDEYLAKMRYRGVESALEGGMPRGWTVEIQRSDEMEEMLMDELYDLREEMSANEGREEGERRWFILKPGMSDKAQGIRLFSTEEKLMSIFEEFDDDSDEEDEDDDEEDGEQESERGESEDPAQQAQEAENKAGPTANGSNSTATRAPDDALRNMILQDFPDDEPYEESQGDDEEDEEDEDFSTGVRTSQLRHFVIQEYVDRPILLDVIDSAPGVGHKFHIRAYVLLKGTYELYLSRTMLALFAGEPYTTPQTGEAVNLFAHLTNTCLQTQADGSLPEHLVKLFWELEGRVALDAQGKQVGRVTQPWLEETFERIGEVIAEAVKAGVECGSFGLQLLPNAFEVFGVDLLLSLPDVTSGETLPPPRISLLEFNASPDFGQSGDRLRPHLAEMFKGVVRLAVAPFFGCEVIEEEKEEGQGKEQKEGEEPVMGETRYVWRMIGRAATRGDW